MGALFNMSFSLIQTFIVAIIAVKWIGLILPFVVIFSYVIISRATIAIKETVRLQSTTKSPIISYLNETIRGISTIRAFGQTSIFIENNNKLLNTNTLSVQMMSGVQGWFAIRVDILAIVLMLIVSLIAVFSRDTADPIILAMLLSYIMTI